MNNIKEIKKHFRLSNTDLAGFFGLSVETFQNSSAKKRYEQAIVLFYNFVKNRENGK